MVTSWSLIDGYVAVIRVSVIHRDMCFRVLNIVFKVLELKKP